MGNLTLRSNLGLLHLVGLLLVANLFVIYFYDIEISRTVRLGSCLLLIGYLLAKRGLRKNFLVVGLLLLLVRDTTVLSYEIPVYKTLSFVCTILTYVAVSVFILKRLPSFQFDRRMVWFTFGIILLNIFNVYYLSDIIIPALDNDIQLMLFFVQSGAMLFMALFAFLYNEAYEGKQSLVLLLCVFAFIFSDLGGLAAYFFGYEPAFYAERAFYVIAAGLLVNYVVNFKAEADQISELNNPNRLRLE